MASVFALSAFSSFFSLDSRSAELGLSQAPASALSGVDEQPVDRFLNFRIKPLGLFYGILGGELQVGVLKWLALGLSVDWFQNTNGLIRSDAYEYGFLASIYLSQDRFQGGWLIQPAYRYSPSKSILNSRDEPQTQSTDEDYSLTLTGGYEWIWRSGFNVHLGFGIASAPKDSTRVIEPMVACQLGFAI